MTSVANHSAVSPPTSPRASDDLPSQTPFISLSCAVTAAALLCLALAVFFQKKLWLHKTQQQQQPQDELLGAVSSSWSWTPPWSWLSSRPRAGPSPVMERRYHAFASRREPVFGDL